MKDVSALTFVEPENSLSSEHTFRKLVVEEILKFAQIKGAITAEGQGGEPFDREVVGGLMLVAVSVVMIVLMVMTVPVVMAVPVVVVVVVILRSTHNTI